MILALLLTSCLLLADNPNPVGSSKQDREWSHLANTAFEYCGVSGEGELWCQDEQSSDLVATGVVHAHGATNSLCFVDDGGGVSCDGEAGPVDNWVAVSAADFKACALHANGDARCWGGTYGPDGTEGGPWAQIDASEWVACGVRESGAVRCWGDEYDDDVIGAEPSGTDWVQVEVDGDAACALRADGDVSCWGDHLYGLEEGPSSSGFVQIAVGDGHGCALFEAGNVECWGKNDELQAEPHGGPFVQISAGGWTTCGRTADHAIECWGHLNAEWP